MKRVALLVSSFALLLVVAVQAEDPKKSLEKLKGSWVITAMTVDGNDNDNAKGDTLTIDGDKWSVKTQSGEEMEGTLKVGAKDKLLTIDIAFTKGNESGKTALGLYEVADSSLKLCMSMPGESDRPADLSAGAGSKRMLIVFKKK
jgi:uncharacterized protein (TIGR03067 family)